MKTYILVFLMPIIFLFSCKKEYTCTCDKLSKTYKTTKNVARAICLEEGYEIIDIDQPDYPATCPEEPEPNQCELKY